MIHHYSNYMSLSLCEKLKTICHWDDKKLSYTYAEALDILLDRGYVVLITPTINPEKFKPGDAITKWDGWVNATRYASAALNFETAAEVAIESAISEIQK